MTLLNRIASGSARFLRVPRLRHALERLVAPFVRADLTSLHADHLALAARLLRLQQEVEQLAAAVSSISVAQPLVVNAIESTNDTARVLRRDYDHLADSLRAEISGLAVCVDALTDRSRT